MGNGFHMSRVDRHHSGFGFLLAGKNRPASGATKQAAAGDESAFGLHLIGDFFGCECDGTLLRDVDFLRDLCREMVCRHALSAVAEAFHQFGPNAGVTGIVALAESHLSVHTWPERRYVILDIYVCNYAENNRDKARALFEALCSVFQPQRRRVHAIDRD